LLLLLLQLQLLNFVVSFNVEFCWFSLAEHGVCVKFRVIFLVYEGLFSVCVVRWLCDKHFVHLLQ
jgi:hypothetical protein